MSAPLLEARPPSPPPPTEAVAAPPAPGLARFGWLREPLVHFIAAGALLFAADRLLIARADDPRTIVVGGDVDREAILTFKAGRGRDPNKEELTALRRVWLDNEVLYREGLALQLDKGDAGIRERVIFKALSTIEGNLKLARPSDDQLRNWFESHRDKYDEPVRFDFEEAVLPGDSSEAALRAFVKQLNGGTPGDAKAGLRVFKGRPESNIVQSYGPELAKALATSKPGEWQALRTRDGWRAIRLNAITPSKPAVFEVVRNPVRQDWIDATAAEQRTAAVRALAKKYKIKHELPGEDDE